MNLPGGNSSFRARRFVLDLLRNCGAFGLARVGSRGMARVLGYHNFCTADDKRPGAVNTRALREQFEYLHRHFRVIPLTQLFEELKLGSLKSNTVAITIDDGRRNFYDFCFPLLEEFGFPATFFVVTSFINGDDWLWTDKLLWLSRQAERPEELGRMQIDRTFYLLNRMPPSERNARIRAFANTMNISVPSTPPSDYAPCSWGELRKMVATGLVEIGSHTVTHPILSSITDEESRNEMVLSRAQIQEELGVAVTSIAFPNGTSADYRENHLKLARETGYNGAVVCGGKLVHATDDPFEMSRIGVGDWTDGVLFSKHLDGVHHIQSAMSRALNWRTYSRTHPQNAEFNPAKMDAKFQPVKQTPL